MLTSFHLHMKSTEVCIKTRSPPALLPIQGHTTVKWPIHLAEDMCKVDTVFKLIEITWRFSFYFRLMEFQVLETLVKLLQSEEEEEELPEQVCTRSILPNANFIPSI